MDFIETIRVTIGAMTVAGIFVFGFVLGVVMQQVAVRESYKAIIQGQLQAAGIIDGKEDPE